MQPSNEDRDPDHALQFLLGKVDHHGQQLPSPPRPEPVVFQRRARRQDAGVGGTGGDVLEEEEWLSREFGARSERGRFSELLGSSFDRSEEDGGPPPGQVSQSSDRSEEDGGPPPGQVTGGPSSPDQGKRLSNQSSPERSDGPPAGQSSSQKSSSRPSLRIPSAPRKDFISGSSPPDEIEPDEEELANPFLASGESAPDGVCSPREGQDEQLPQIVVSKSHLVRKERRRHVKSCGGGLDHALSPTSRHYYDTFKLDLEKDVFAEFDSQGLELSGVELSSVVQGRAAERAEGAAQQMEQDGGQEAAPPLLAICDIVRTGAEDHAVATSAPRNNSEDSSSQDSFLLPRGSADITPGDKIASVIGASMGRTPPCYRVQRATSQIPLPGWYNRWKTLTASAEEVGRFTAKLQQPGFDGRQGEKADMAEVVVEKMDVEGGDAGGPVQRRPEEKMDVEGGDAGGPVQRKKMDVEGGDAGGPVQRKKMDKEGGDAGGPVQRRPEGKVCKNGLTVLECRTRFNINRPKCKCDKKWYGEASCAHFYPCFILPHVHVSSCPPDKSLQLSLTAWFSCP